MIFDKFKTNLQVMRKENNWSRLLIAGFMVITIVLSYSLASRKPVITLVPPNLNEEAQLHHNKASEAIHKAWSLYMAESLGNVTPTTAAFVRITLDPLLDASIRDEALIILEKQIDQIRRDQVSFSFQPREVTFDERDGKVYVIGRHTISESRDSRAQGSVRTFEFKWNFKNHMPHLVFIDTYEGATRIR